MDFDVGRRRGQSRTPREATSKEVLAQAKAERADRQRERQRQQAAATIQRWWRGSRARGATRARLRRAWLQQHGAVVAQTQQALPAAQLADAVLPPTLLAYLPAPGQQRQALVDAGTPLPPALLADAAALRGCFALVLRSLAASESAGLLAWAAAAMGSGDQARVLSQLRRLLLLCCASLGGRSADPLLQAAAGRLVSILCDPSQWKRCLPAGGAPAGAAAAAMPENERRRQLQQALYGWLAPLPLLAAAAQRLVTGLAGPVAPQLQRPENGTQPQPHQQQQQQLAGVLNSLVAAQLHLNQCLAALGDARSAQQAAQQLLHQLATPGLLPLLSPATTAQLTAAPSFAALLQAAGGWQPVLSPGSRAADQQQLCLLGALAQLAAGKKAIKQLEAGGQARQLGYLPPSAVLQQQGVAVALAAAALALLGAALQAGGGGAAAAAEALEAQLWPFAEAAFALQLLQQLPTREFVQLYHLLLRLADSARGAIAGSGGRGAGAAAPTRLLSALAFGVPALLPQLWRHLALGIGLPLEAPMEATRGWEVPTLRCGIAGLAPEAAMELGLFCRVYHHALQVVDDAEFFQRQAPFSLGQQRAIAAALNTLVFRTQLPEAGGTAAAARGGGGTAAAAAASAMLQVAAPLLHRALYERDARRTFCPPALWLEPYRHLSAGGGVAQQPVSGAAVVRALLAATDDGDGDDGSSATTGVGLAAASRPAAVAAVLQAAPQCVPFEERLAVFRALVELDKERRGYHLAPIEGGQRPLPLTIRRGYVLEDAATQLARLPSAKAKLSITFINQQGLQEAGIDMGGLMKEFLDSVTAAGFDPNRGLFAATPDGAAYPNPLAARLDGGLAALEALGCVLGRALYEGVLLEAPLAPFFVGVLQGRRPLFDELAGLDPEVHRSLAALKRYEGDWADLGLDFTVESDFLGSTVSEELVAGGSRLAVTADNALQYVYLVADWHLNKRLGPAAAAFSRGLSRVIPAPWLRLFSPKEVNQLLGGGEAGAIDIEDMRQHTVYSGYSATSSTVKHFWAVVRVLGPGDQRALLKFITSSSRAPLGGFRHLNPPLTIHKVDCGAGLLAAVGGRDVDRLPSASTCSNTLKLPNFRRASTLRDKLVYAIRAGAGFELS